MIKGTQYYIGCDKHKRYSTFAVMDEQCRVVREARVENTPELLRQFYRELPPGSPIAVETTGSWYWFVDLIEEEGHIPLLTHAKKAKVMMGHIDKTDKLDTRGLAKLLKNGTLPSVWIPSKEIRDKRELLRTRMSLSRVRTSTKNIIHAMLSKYGVKIEGVSDLFGNCGRELLSFHMEEFPPETRRMVELRLVFLDQIQGHIDGIEDRLGEILRENDQMQLLMTLPGIGKVLSAVIAYEVGDVTRFPSPSHFSSYAGLVPRVYSSGGRTFYGKTRRAARRVLKWAFVEAADVISIHHRRWTDRYLALYYRRLRERKGHGKATVAVARHLSESAWWVLTKKEPYREPERIVCSSGRGVACNP